MNDFDAALGEVTVDRRTVDNLRRQVADAKADRDVAEQAHAKAARELSLMLGLDRLRREPPKWTTKAPKAGKHHGTPWLLLSDLHLDEVVRPEEIGSSNAYNRRIAELRLKATFQGAAELPRRYWTGLEYDGIVCAMLGDIYSGDIHDELAQTNEDTILGSVLHWADHLAAGLTLLADEYGKVHVPVVVGNHGRRSRKPRAKFRARDNFDWFTGHLLARTLQADRRITFDVSDSADLLVQSYGTRIMCTHGDQASGGAGIGGIWPPIMRLQARKQQRQAAVNQGYDQMVLGHWHSLTFGRDWVVNGSTKGLDEYSFQGNFGFEPPQQALFLVTPEHGRTWCAPIYCQDRGKEDW